MGQPSTVGIIANPASARDIRRIVAHGGSTTTHDKLNMLRRVMAGLAAAGIDRVISMADRGGITAGLARFAARESAVGWPAIEFVDQEITQTALDTSVATSAMLTAGVGAIVVLGGDGTNSVVAHGSGSVPLVSISTGTNNAFPQPIEPTVAGLAAGIVATDPATRVAGTYRAKKLVVNCADRREEALVDVAITRGDQVGSGAVWDADSISEVFLAFAEPENIGLSAIGGHVRPIDRRCPSGLSMILSECSELNVRAPIAPGLLPSVAIASVTVMEPATPLVVETHSGVVALDGERRFRFGAANPPTVMVSPDGPLVVDVKAALEHAAKSGLLTNQRSKGDPRQSK